MRALDFGLGIDSDGFNIFALGESGTGKMTTVMTLLKEKAAQEETPEDWCYVYNFKDPDTSHRHIPGTGTGCHIPEGDGGPHQRAAARDTQGL